MVKLTDEGVVFEVMEEIFPVPEALTQTPWEVVGGETPRLMPASNKLIVPLSPDQHDQVLRTHELAHIKWSPKEIPKDLNPAILAMVEDMRIIYKMRAAGVNLEPGYPEEMLAYAVAKLRATRDKWGAFLFRAGMTGMPGQKLVDDALGKAVGIGRKEQALLTSMRSSLSANLEPSWSFSWTRKLMEHIADDRAEKEEERKKGQSATKKGAAEAAADRTFEKYARRQAEKDAIVTEEWAKGSEEERSSVYSPDGIPRPRWWESSKMHHPWGAMRMDEPPLTQRMPGRFGRQRRPSDSGSALTYPFRLWQDQKVFGRKLRGRGGSVLIDGSGSMSLTPAQIWKILENAPGATIAIYSSESSTTKSGVLRILARKGLVVKADLACSQGGGNVVDFPALQWLAKQEEPRVWVSDGCVTGMNERSSHANRAECYDLCKKKKILRTPHMEQAILLFEQLRKMRAGISAGFDLHEHEIG